ncbi:hypothetical protein BV25DRAFT_1833581 [Artomyces pyxidatus]|uniref:Uncharacterized protein n=1 Tax=Artomyces pyxidatus TaxID=48021 RepID=A0ACB8SFC5_9AGAM|nr:hypothetical protein BV25DRAFT_1833581 [Artomyces pyxidatus]
MAQGTWHVIVTTRPGDATRPAWDVDNYKAMGVIRLRCTPQIAAKIKGSLLAVTMWETLEREYGKPGISAIFSEFKAALAVEIPNNAHPAAAIDEIAMHLSRIAEFSQDAKIPDFVHAMLVISKAPSSYNYLQQLVSQTPLGEIKLEAVKPMFVNAWEGQDKKGKSTANKLSAIKCKRDDPKFQQQQQPSGSAKQNKRKFRQCGKRAGRRCYQHADQGGHDHNHSHVASMADVRTFEVSMPSTQDVRKPFYQEKHKKLSRTYQKFQKAMTLAKDLDLTPSFERLCALEDVCNAMGPVASSSKDLDTVLFNDNNDRVFKHPRNDLELRIDWAEDVEMFCDEGAVSFDEEDVDDDIAEAAACSSSY